MSASKAEARDYSIRGGVQGRERLRVLSRALQPATADLFRRVGVRMGMDCLDIGCGAGDVSFDLARMVTPGGHVVGIDIDGVKIDMARQEAAAQKIANVEFLLGDVRQSDIDRQFDIVYARYLLSHLHNPAVAVAKMYQLTRPGGIIIVIDGDVIAGFCYPTSAAFQRFVELWMATVERRGGTGTMGPRLASLLKEAGVKGIQINVVQPAAMEADGDAKLITPITMENIADSAVAEGLASREEIDKLIAELYALAHDPSTAMSFPRTVEVWGYRPRPPV